MQHVDIVILGHADIVFCREIECCLQQVFKGILQVRGGDIKCKRVGVLTHITECEGTCLCIQPDSLDLVECGVWRSKIAHTKPCQRGLRQHCLGIRIIGAVVDVEHITRCTAGFHGQSDVKQIGRVHRIVDFEQRHVLLAYTVGEGDAIDISATDYGDVRPTDAIEEGVVDDRLQLILKLGIRHVVGECRREVTITIDDEADLEGAAGGIDRDLLNLVHAADIGDGIGLRALAECESHRLRYVTGDRQQGIDARQQAGIADIDDIRVSTGIQEGVSGDILDVELV